ncbi:MAG TPA: M23 family metallopeptidase [Jiangellaceae bacterium]|nr:M23 family metallopeptidase [Jiangellaceae bacterium]
MVTTARREATMRAARAERMAELEANRWVAPTSNYRVTATFGAGGSMWSSRHTGIDLAAPTGTPVVAAAAGEIVEAGWNGPYGQEVVIRHSDGTETAYGHLSRIVKNTGSVQAGEQIGLVGSTGNSTGSHLHLEVRPDGGEPVNPRPFLAEQGLEL